MKNDLTCALVQDLLPNYVEGLTSPETNDALERHLDGCVDCTACKNAMIGGEDTAAEATARQAKEVDYLKTVKKKTGRRVILAVVCTVLLFAAGIGLKLFVIGEPASREGMSWSMGEDAGALELRVFSTWSGVAYCRWETETVDGVVNITARQVLPSYLYRDADHRMRVPLEGVKEVWLANQLLWQEGVMIQQGDDLYAVKTPYVGDIVALNEVARALNLTAELGEYHNSLHTSSHPYRWTLEIADDTGGAAISRFYYMEKTMPRLAAQMLALVGNLEEVGWTYTDLDGEFHSECITLDEVNALLPEWTAAYNEAFGTDWEALPSVKDYADSPAKLQTLTDLCYLFH